MRISKNLMQRTAEPEHKDQGVPQSTKEYQGVCKMNSHRIALVATTTVAVFSGIFLFPHASASIDEDGVAGPLLIMLSWAGVVGVVAILSFLVAEITEDEKMMRETRAAQGKSGEANGKVGETKVKEKKNE